jgi:hydrogenase nickel incorporation protein HypA/HybF
MSIAQSILDIVNQEMTKNGLTKLIKVQVKYGWLTNTMPEALELAFEALTLDGQYSPLKGAVFALEAVPTRYQCGQCGIEFSPEEPAHLFVPCPGCGEEFGHKVLAGKELYIDFIEAQ